MVRVRDLSIAGKAVWLRWRKRRYRCQGCRRTFTESHAELPSRQRVTRRYRRRLRERVVGGAAHAEVARCERTTRYQVQRAFRDAADELAERRERRPTRRLSLDEAHHRRGRELATVASDLDRRAVIEVLDGRSRPAVELWLRSPPDERRRAIEVVSIDPSEAYRQAVRSKLPWARIVVDPFHLVRGAGLALDTVRRERQHQAASSRRSGGRKGVRASWRPELYRSRHRLLGARERLSERDRRSSSSSSSASLSSPRRGGSRRRFERSTRPPIAPRPRVGSTPSSPPSSARRSPPSPPLPPASACGGRRSSPTSTSRPPTATPRA